MSTVKSKNKNKRRKVTFSLDLSGAKEVILMGDFNNWSSKKHLMRQDGNGVWNKAVLLPPGSYQYKFLVDGQWREDPKNDQACFFHGLSQSTSYTIASRFYITRLRRSKKMKFLYHQIRFSTIRMMIPICLILVYHVMRLFLKSIVKHFVFGFSPKQRIYFVLNFLSFLA